MKKEIAIQTTELTREERAAIANTIIQQLGGRMFMTMTGAKNFLALGEYGGVKFNLPNGRFYTRDGGNCVIIRLNVMDLYDVEYGRLWGAKYRIIRKVPGVYCDQLQGIFTKLTGLDTSL